MLARVRRIWLCAGEAGTGFGAHCGEIPAASAGMTDLVCVGGTDLACAGVMGCVRGRRI